MKTVAKSLLKKLKTEKLVLDWRKQQTTRAMVLTTIKDVLDELPRTYTKDLYDQKCDVVYQHFYEAYVGQGKSLVRSQLTNKKREIARDAAPRPHQKATMWQKAVGARRAQPSDVEISEKCFVGRSSSGMKATGTASQVGEITEEVHERSGCDKGKR